LEGLLIDFGYEVIGKCIKGEDAVGLYQTHHPDILFVEIHIDGVVTGLEVVRQVQGIGKPMVICIGSDLKGSVLEQVKEVMPNGYLCKPFDEEQLKTTTNIALYTDLEEKKKSAELSKKSEMQQMNIQELSETNSHLVAATWRERDLKKQLKDSLEQLELNKAIIEQQNKRIVDSINYANRIQQAIIPTSVDVSVMLPNHFMIYRPKDVVSGDFPWMFKKDEFVYFGAVDCTGHGVPGAMLSMIGYLLLNGIADVEGEDKTPSQVLFELHHQIVETLKQNLEGNNASDGMGIALCRINTETNEVMYSGVHRPLCHLSEGNVIQYKGDRFPIGGVQYRSEYVFTDTKIQVKEGESIYFFSD
jgi:serine phosphatase RsbU (regulator of sigma subunit)